MAVIAPSPAGGAITYVAAAAGQTYVNSGREELHVKNASGGSINVTFTAVGQCSHGFLHDKIQAVGPGADVLLAAADLVRFGTSVAVSWSATASITVAVIAP